ncbi:DcaP family trimeric outer membrane transporter [Fulvivirga sedimenti]|uniref:Porin n=1 Tax=Fulvivirga sedimenti TaxID=2879465 RepID=A0A9X1HLF3_9BACT|nr:DcaP family trimeric outer membrane transporter [Fulvivirga sedimenti]MCA6073466.1 hypothetical protein [Fulvivirga sedimenti]
MIRPIILSVLLSLMISVSNDCNGQSQPDNQKRIIGTNTADTLRSDSTKYVEFAPLDIAQDRGLYIVTPDGKMQLRILGSVRYLVGFDNIRLSDKNSLNTYEIPTGERNVPIPNYSNGLEQTRLGFEVTRKTERGDIFIRLETDFAGADGFMIRHAYGQYRKFLFGQTWSLFSHLNASPATVDFSGPTSSTVTRTPQLRYSTQDFFKGINLAIGLEYIVPDFALPDSITFESFQVIPDFTIRLDKSFDWGSVQLSGIMPVLSGRNDSGDLVLQPGWGISGSTVLNSWKKGTWYFQGVAGQAITRYFNDLNGNGLDLILSPAGQVRAPVIVGFYGTYEHHWNSEVYSNFTYGILHVKKYDFTPDESYLKGRSFRANTFWDIADGAKIGGEIVYGQRIDVSHSKGDAFRVSLLFYYDF